MNVYKYWDSWLFFPRLLAICAAIFVICLCLDAIRAAVFKLPSVLIKRNGR